MAATVSATRLAARSTVPVSVAVDSPRGGPRWPEAGCRRRRTTAAARPSCSWPGWPLALLTLTVTTKDWSLVTST